jgi:uncharacterized membrane protein
LTSLQLTFVKKFWAYSLRQRAWLLPGAAFLRWWMLNPASDGFQLASVSDAGWHWTLRRNCSVAPAQLACVFAGLSALSLAVAAFFWFQGAVLVLPFAALELLALGAAFLATARHATDGEQISLHEGRLVVEVESAGRIHRSEFVADRVRVKPVRGHALVEVAGDGRSVRLGRFIRTDLRPVLARELRQALRKG